MSDNRRRYRGNAVMITKVLSCADQAGTAAARAERQKLRDTIGVAGLERRTAAQAKRERKRAAALRAST